MNSKILHTPEGVRDVYGEEFHRKKYVCNCIMEKIHSYGYEDIQTPMFEYFDVFSQDIGTIPARELYKFFDKEGDTLVIRPDFTPSIARCAAKYFMEEQVPLRFCYEGNTFINTLELQGKLKETTQLGVEYIGNNSISADAEILCMVIEGLKNTGLNEFQVSIGEVSYFKELCEEYGLCEEDELNIRDYLSAKNFFGAEEYLNSKKINSAWIQKLMPLPASEEFFVKARSGVNSSSKAAIDRLYEIYEIIVANGYERYVSFDLSILSKYHYYSGILFRAYTYGVGDAIVKGGRYDGLLQKFGKDSPAIGCVFLADEIQTALKRQNIDFSQPTEDILLLYDDDTYCAAVLKAKELRLGGKNVAMVQKLASNDLSYYERYANEHGKEYITVI